MVIYVLGPSDTLCWETIVQVISGNKFSFLNFHLIMVPLMVHLMVHPSLVEIL